VGGQTFSAFVDIKCDSQRAKNEKEYHCRAIETAYCFGGNEEDQMIRLEVICGPEIGHSPNTTSACLKRGKKKWEGGKKA